MKKVEQITKFFTFSQIPQPIIKKIFGNLPISDLPALTRIEKINKQNNKDNDVFWNSVKLSALKSKYPYYVSLIDELMQKKYPINDICRAITYFGAEATKDTAILFLNLIGDNYLSYNVTDQDYTLLSNFILNLPQHSISSYLLEKKEQEKLDYLCQNYHQLLINAAQNYRGEALNDESSLHASSTKLCAYTISSFVDKDTFAYFTSELKTDSHFIIQMLTFGLRQKNQQIIFFALQFLTFFIELNQTELLQNSLKLLEKELIYLSSLSLKNSDSEDESSDSDGEIIQPDNKFFTTILSKWLFSAMLSKRHDCLEIISQFIHSNQISIDQRDLSLENAACSIIQGDHNLLEKLLTTYKENCIDYHKFDLPLYTVYTKQNISKIFTVLEKFNIRFDTTQKYSIKSETLRFSLDYKQDDSLRDFLKPPGPLMLFAIIGQNLNLIEKLFKENPEVINEKITIPFHFNDSELNPIEFALLIKAFSVAHYLISLGAKNTLSPIYTSLILLNFNSFVTHLRELDTDEEINQPYSPYGKSYLDDKTFLEEALEIDYRVTPADFICQKVCFMLLAKGANPLQNYFSFDNSVSETISHGLSNNCSIKSTEKEFIHFMFRYYEILFSSNSPKNKVLIVMKSALLDLTEKLAQNESAKVFFQDKSNASQKIENFIMHFSDAIQNVNDMDEHGLIDKLRETIIYYQNPSLTKILEFMINFLNLHENLMPLLDPGPSHSLVMG